MSIDPSIAPPPNLHAFNTSIPPKSYLLACGFDRVDDTARRRVEQEEQGGRRRVLLLFLFRDACARAKKIRASWASLQPPNRRPVVCWGSVAGVRIDFGMVKPSPIDQFGAPIGSAGRAFLGQAAAAATDPPSNHRPHMPHRRRPCACLAYTTPCAPSACRRFINASPASITITTGGRRPQRLTNKRAAASGGRSVQTTPAAAGEPSHTTAGFFTSTPRRRVGLLDQWGGCLARRSIDQPPGLPVLGVWIPIRPLPLIVPAAEPDACLA